MKGQKVYECKSHCREFQSCCHDTKNRCIEKMCVLDKNDCKKVAKFLKCLMTCEDLCCYICTCCCEMEEISDHCYKELCNKCDKLLNCCNDLKSCLSNENCNYLNCDKLVKCCNNCKNMNKKNKKSKSR